MDSFGGVPAAWVAGNMRHPQGVPVRRRQGFSVVVEDGGVGGRVAARFLRGL
jgi:hypothetical protein